MAEVSEELSRQGLEPRDWQGVLRAVEAKLAPADFRTFTRLHGNFIGYLSEGTLLRFYGFVFSHGLQLDINCYRYRRLESLLRSLVPLAGAAPVGRVLEVGAGAGAFARAARSLLGPRAYVVHDICPEAEAHLASLGFAILPATGGPAPAAAQEPFDLILCPDSLGEINSDEDGYLKDPARSREDGFPRAVEERYGFAMKLRGWKTRLAPGGRILLWEPIAIPAVWEALAEGLRAEGWLAGLRETVAEAPCLELTLP